MKPMWRILGFSFVCMAIGGLGACGGSDDDDQELPRGVAARVGNQLVREAAVRAELQEKYAVQGGTVASYGPPGYRACLADKRRLGLGGDGRQKLRSGCKTEYEIARAEAVDVLVQARLLEREAKRHGIDPERVLQLATAKADRLVARIPGAEAIGDRGPTFRVQTHTAKLGAAMPVTEQEIQEYARANFDVFLRTERREVRVLQTAKQAEALAGGRALRRGASWEQIQGRYGAKPFAQGWTGTHVVAESSAPHDAFGRTLFSTQPHRLLGPIHTLNGWFVFEVLDVIPVRGKALSPEAHDAVAEWLRERKLEALLRKHYAGQTECAKAYNLAEAPHCF